jgi:hypothetical protein
VSYLPFRDNQDLAGLPDDAYDQLLFLGDLIDASHATGLHEDLCNCTKPDCKTLDQVSAMPRPSTEEVLGWLVAKGLLPLNARPAMPVGTAQDTNGHLVLVCPYSDCGQHDQIRVEDHAVETYDLLGARLVDGRLVIDAAYDGPPTRSGHHRYVCTACRRTVITSTKESA